MTSNISKPQVFGPGVWFTLHLTALNSKTREEQLFFIKTMKNIIQNLPCNDCRQHASRYLSQNPPENYLGLVDGLFIYTIKFHNFVNERLGKPILSEEEAKALYLNPNICYEDCGKEKSIPLVSIAPDLAPILVSVRPYQKKR